MGSIYRSEASVQSVRRWCVDQLDRWVVPHQRTLVTAEGAATHVVTAGVGATTVVLVPGTNFNAATSLPLATALVNAGHRVMLLDVPGQPGLSSGDRGPSDGRLSFYGAWLSRVLDEMRSGPVTILGHSLGAAIALSCTSPRIDRLVLVSPGGLTRLRIGPSVLAASAAWYMRPTPERSARLLHAMYAPGHQPRAALVEWMTLLARHSRSSGSPGTVHPPTTTAHYTAVGGEHDRFLPPQRLGRAVRTALGVDLEVLANTGHLLVEEHPEYLASLVDSDDEAAAPRDAR